MYCKNCGKKLKKDETFCTNCGQGKDEPVVREENNVKQKNKNMSLSVGFGIGCIIASFFISVLCIPFGIVSIVYYVKARKEGETNPVGLILSIIGMVIGIIILILWVLLFKFVFEIIEDETYRNNYNRIYERYNYDNNYDNYHHDYDYDDYNEGDLIRSTVGNWLNLVKSSDMTVTVITNNSCTNCNRYLDHVEDVADDINKDIIWFNIDSLSDADKTSLTGAFTNIKNNTTYPYTIVTQNNKIIKEIKGYTSERDLRDVLLSLGINNTSTNTTF